MRYIDLLAQTILMLLGVTFAIVALYNGNTAGLLLVQLIVGVWQLTSCFFSLLFYTRRDNRSRHLHLASSLIVIILLIIVSQIHVGLANVLLLGPPWILAIYYYSITWRIVFPRYKNQSKFLPHISF
jgi:hypothetical protein